MQPPRAVGDTRPVPMDVDGGEEMATAVADAAGPATRCMSDLLALVHQVFMGHAFAPQLDAACPSAAAAAASARGSAPPFRVHYVRAGQLVVVYFVPVQRHLVVYTGLEAQQGGDGFITRVALQLGMASASVMAKVDYLLVYPLLCGQCTPSLQAVPPEVCFGLLLGLSLPGLAALGTASRTMARAVFEDDTLWWRIALLLSPSVALSKAIGDVMERQKRGEVVPAGSSRQMVKGEVQRQREEAEARRRRIEEARRLEEAMRRQWPPGHDPLRLPGGRPSRGGPGFGGIIGGDRDLFPGGLDPFGGGRRPFGGGGFGGGLF